MEREFLSCDGPHRELLQRKQSFCLFCFIAPFFFFSQSVISNWDSDCSILAQTTQFPSQSLIDKEKIGSPEPFWLNKSKLHGPLPTGFRSPFDCHLGWNAAAWPMRLWQPPKGHFGSNLHYVFSLDFDGVSSHHDSGSPVISLIFLWCKAWVEINGDGLDCPMIWIALNSNESSQKKLRSNRWCCSTGPMSTACFFQTVRPFFGKASWWRPPKCGKVQEV